MLCRVLPAIIARGLMKSYAGRAVVDDLDLTIERGECFALLGPNGAGKTTTVEILEGFRRRDACELRAQSHRRLVRAPGEDHLLQRACLRRDRVGDLRHVSASSARASAHR